MLNHNIMTPDHIQKQIEQAFRDGLEETYHLIYTNYNDTLNECPELIQKCMDDQITSPAFEKIFDWFQDYQYEVCRDIIGQLQATILNDNKYSDIHPYIDEWLSDWENKENIRCLIEERDQSNPVKEIIGRTKLRARITQFSNFESLPSNWDMRSTYQYEDYFKDIIDALYLNPSIVKQTFRKTGINTTGRWPNLAYRNGKEAVEYDAFAEELLNQSSYCQLVFMGMFPLQCLFSNGFKQYHKITVPKGNNCGLYNSWNGGGSILEMKLKRDLTLPVQLPGKTKYDRFELVVDEKNCEVGYCIDEVYGLITEAWGEEFKPIFK